MRRIFTALLFFLALIVCFASCGTKAEGFQEQYSKYIYESPIWSIKKISPHEEDEDDTIYVYTAFWSFSALQLEKTDLKPGEIKYKMVFNPPEKVKGAKTITVLIGENALTVNDETFGFADKTIYQNVFKMIEDKYIYYLSLQE